MIYIVKQSTADSNTGQIRILTFCAYISDVTLPDYSRALMATDNRMEAHDQWPFGSTCPWSSPLAYFYVRFPSVLPVERFSASLTRKPGYLWMTHFMTALHSLITERLTTDFTLIWPSLCMDNFVLFTTRPPTKGFVTKSAHIRSCFPISSNPFYGI